MPNKPKKPAPLVIGPAVMFGRGAAETNALMTAANAIKLIETWSDLPAAKRRELTSALNTCSRVAGEPLASLVLTPEHLRESVVRKPLAVWDMEPGSKANVLSRLRTILCRLGKIDTPDEMLSPDWRTLFELADKRARMSLVTLMKYLSSRNIAPDQAADSHLDDFENRLTTRTINAEPRALTTAARRAWNKMAKTVESWPKTILSLESARGQMLLPFSACPASFAEDVTAYKEKLNGQNVDELFGITIDSDDTEADAFDEMADKAGKDLSGPVVLRPLTVETKLQHIKVAFNALHRAGVPLSDITALSCLVSPLHHPQKIITQLLSENGGATKPVTAHVAEMLRQIAKFHVGCPPKQLAQLTKWTKRVRVDYHEMTISNRKKLSQICTKDRLRKLRDMPDALMLQAEEQGPTFRAAVAARRAAMLALLIRAPMRLGNLMTLRLDEHIVCPDARAGRISAIVIDAEQTKNRLSLTYPLSENTSSILQRWINEFRPRLTPQGNPYLFGGNGLSPMTRAGMRDTIKAITFECLGVAINPHLFRHIAAAVFLEACPGGFEDLRRLLGHKTLQTTTRAYTRIENTASVIKFDKILDAIDETMGVLPKPAKKRRTKPKAPAKRPARKKGARS